MQGLLPHKTYQKAKKLVLTAGVVLLGLMVSIVVGYVMASPTFGWTGTTASALPPICQPENVSVALLWQLLHSGTSQKTDG